MEELEQLIIGECVQADAQLDANQLGSLLVNIGNSRSKESGFQKQQLAEFEGQIANDLPSYVDKDITLLISAFIKLKHVPSNLIEALLKQDDISTYQRPGSYKLLNNMIYKGVINQPKLYAKLWEAYEATIPKQSLARCS